MSIIRAALFAAVPLLLFARTDVPPTEADQRFKAKYGIWPPHITYQTRTEQDRARSVKQPKAKKEKPKAKQQERERQ